MLFSTGFMVQNIQNKWWSTLTISWYKILCIKSFYSKDAIWITLKFYLIIKLKKIYFVAIKIPNKRWYDHKTAPSIYKNHSCKPRLWGSQKKKNLCAAIRQYIGTKPASIVRNCAKLGIRPRIYASISWKTNL